MSKRILIIDDDAGLATAYQAILKSQGHEVTYISSGPQALEYLANHAIPDIIFLDCAMPEMSGEDFMEALESSYPEVIKQARIVGISNYMPGSRLTRDFEKKVHLFEEKPSRIEDLTELIRRVSSLNG